MFVVQHIFVLFRRIQFGGNDCLEKKYSLPFKEDGYSTRTITLGPAKKRRLVGIQQDQNMALLALIRDREQHIYIGTSETPDVGWLGLTSLTQ